MPDHFSGIRTEDKPCRVQGIIIEKRVLLLDGKDYAALVKEVEGLTDA